MAARWFGLHSLLLIEAHRQTGQIARHGARFRTIGARAVDPATKMRTA